MSQPIPPAQSPSQSLQPPAQNPNDGKPVKFDIMPAIIGPLAGIVTILLHSIGFPPLFIGTFLALVGLYYTYKDQINAELLFSLLSRFIVHVFFRESQSRNAHRIPVSGPVIFICAPHNNQFLDPAVVQEFVPRPISWLIAAKSYRDPTIGKFARAQRAIPVERPQDLAKSGTGKIFHRIQQQDSSQSSKNDKSGESTDSSNTTLVTDDHNDNEQRLTIYGNIDTDFFRDFTDNNKTNSIGIAGEIYQIAKVIDAHCLLLKASTESFPPSPINESTPIGYKVVPKVDQNSMFQHVWSTLCQGNCVGIFPEGGSHDRTELLPLKAGVAIMALGGAAKILEQYEEECRKNNVPVDYSAMSRISLVAVGLNYFHGHRFRGRVYVEYGDPFHVPHELILQFKKGGPSKIDACNTLLDIIRDQLKSVTVSAPSWAQLQVLWAVRRLYQPSGLKLPPKLVVVLIRRFSEGYELVKDRPDVKQLVAEVEQYNETLKYYGLRDHQVNITQQSRTGALLKLLFRAAKLAFLTLFAIPGSILNIPILLITRFISKKKAAEALKASTVKVAARDVIGSWKVLTSLTVVPLVLCINPLIVATLFSSYWPWLTIWGNFVILQPLMMWAGVILLERGGIIYKSLQPLWFAAFPDDSRLRQYAASIRSTATSTITGSKDPQSTTKTGSIPELHPHIVELRQTRARLRHKIRSLVDILGPLIYGPAFNQLRIFPSQGSSNNPSDLSLSPLFDLKARKPGFEEQDSVRVQPRETAGCYPSLIPQISDQSDAESTPRTPRASALSTTISEGEDLNNSGFTINSDGEYTFNQDGAKELQVPASALELLLKQPMSLNSPNTGQTDTKNNSTGGSSSTPTQLSRIQGGEAASKQKKYFNSVSSDDDDGELTCKEETMLVDGLQLNVRYQSLLFSRSLQPITHSLADSMSVGSNQPSICDTSTRESLVEDSEGEESLEPMNE